MNDERMQPLLEGWFKDREVAPTNVQHSASQVMAKVPEVRQRGRWWPLPTFHRKAKTQSPTATDTTDYRPSPIPATNGHAPTVIWRTQTMFSPVKAITAGALVFALGGVLLIAQPFDQQGDSLPGAATEADAVTDPMAPALVTGTITRTMSDSSPGTLTIDEDATVFTTGFVGLADWEASDPRLSGTDTYTANWQRYAAGFTVEAATRVLENADGRWVGTTTGLTTSPVTSSDTIILHGEDAYEGLTAYVLIDYKAFPGGEFVAAIFPGEMPSFPDLPAE